jgi:phosphoribosylanthranilate isomerase
MFVKICGITNREDALAAVEAGARAIGFVFADSSPRAANPAHVEHWISDIPADIWKVGVFVDQTPEIMEETAARLDLDIAQLHGSETPAQHPRHIRVWRAFRVRTAEDRIADYPAEAILIDGAAFDWSRAAEISHPLILAGGLNPDNVAESIARVRRHCEPWAVDVASGIEASPGRKDHARMKEFIQAALRS